MGLYYFNRMHHCNHMAMEVLNMDICWTCLLYSINLEMMTDKEKWSPAWGTAGFLSCSFAAAEAVVLKALSGHSLSKQSRCDDFLRKYCFSTEEFVILPVDLG